jgi:hypothetical protein
LVLTLNLAIKQKKTHQNAHQKVYLASKLLQFWLGAKLNYIDVPINTEKSTSVG